MKTYCLTCGTITTGSRCEDCRRTYQRHDRRSRVDSKYSTGRGYNKRWRRLSERARRLQPFCADCGTADDLQTDHSPEAWRRHEAGLAIRLQDVDVVCGACNRARGAARPGRGGTTREG